MLHRLASLLLIAAAFVCQAAAPQAAQAETSVALVVGNSAYENVGRLPNPVSDAAEVAALLQKLGFDVTLKQNLGLKQMVDALKAFEDKAAVADVAVVYFAGHGLEMNGTNWLIPTDAELKRDTHVDVEAISLEKVRTTIENAGRLRVIILDACRDNPFMKTMTLSSRSTITRGLGRVEADGSEVIAYSAKEGTVAADGAGNNSPFTKSLLKHLAEPGVDVRFLFGAVRDEVLAETKKMGRPQEPVVYQNLGGKFTYLVMPPADTSSSDAARPSMRDDFELSKQAGKVEVWDAFLAHYPDGFLSDLARQERRKLAIVEPAAPVARVPQELQQEPAQAPLQEPSHVSPSAALVPDLPKEALPALAVPPAIEKAQPQETETTKQTKKEPKLQPKPRERVAEIRTHALAKPVAVKPKAASGCFSFGGSHYCN